MPFTRQFALVFACSIILFGCAGEAVIPEPEPDIIAFVARNPTTRITALYTSEIDGKNLELISPITTLTSSRIAVTQGGRFLFFSGKGGSELPLVLFNVSTGQLTMMGQATAVFPTVSPDGSRLIWFETTGGQFSLVMCKSDGTERTVLVDGTAFGRPLRVEAAPSWSPDGTMIAFSAIDTTSRNTVGPIPHVITLATRTIARFRTSDFVGAPQFLANDTLIYVSSERIPYSLKRYALSTGVDSTITSALPALNSTILSISPDRSTVVCINPLTIVDLKTARVFVKTTNDAVIHNQMWSPNGNSFIYGDRTPNTLYSERLYHLSKRGEQLPLVNLDTIGSSASVVWLR